MRENATVHPAHNTEFPEMRWEMRHIDWEIPANIAAIGKYTDEFGKVLASDFNYTEGEVFWFQEALREGLANAIVHGNLGIRKIETGDQEKDEQNFQQAIEQAQKSEEAKKLKVHVTIEITKKGLTIAIQDHGGARAKKMAQEFLTQDPRTDNNLFKTQGRGGLLMQHAFGKEGVRYFINDIGTKLVLTKTRNEQEMPPN